MPFDPTKMDKNMPYVAAGNPYAFGALRNDGGNGKAPERKPTLDPDTGFNSDEEFAIKLARTKMAQAKALKHLCKTVRDNNSTTAEINHISKTQENELKAAEQLAEQIYANVKGSVAGETYKQKAQQKGWADLESIVNVDVKKIDDLVKVLFDQAVKGWVIKSGRA